jgi:hypothetical protein
VLRVTQDQPGGTGSTGSTGSTGRYWCGTGPTGVGITSTSINASGNLIITYSSGITANAGLFVAQLGLVKLVQQDQLDMATLM